MRINVTLRYKKQSSAVTICPLPSSVLCHLRPFHPHLGIPPALTLTSDEGIQGLRAQLIGLTWALLTANPALSLDLHWASPDAPLSMTDFKGPDFLPQFHPLSWGEERFVSYPRPHTVSGGESSIGSGVERPEYQFWMLHTEELG